MLTYMIKGSYYEYAENRQFGDEKPLSVIGDMAEGIIVKLK